MKLEKCRKIAFSGGVAGVPQYYIGICPAQHITILHREGGEGGVSGDPLIVLRNIWTASEITHLNSLTVLKKTFGLRAILDN